VRRLLCLVLLLLAALIVLGAVDRCNTAVFDAAEEMRP
jgi:hypothetical protein